jgi:hypothetical protein
MIRGDELPKIVYRGEYCIQRSSVAINIYHRDPITSEYLIFDVIPLVQGIPKKYRDLLIEPEATLTQQLEKCQIATAKLSSTS